VHLNFLEDRRVATPIVSRDEWLAARRELLQEEKRLTHARESVARQRRAMPRVQVEKEYHFDTERGPQTLAELFNGRSQLIVYHFMFGPDWTAGCPHCSFWADSYNGTTRHLAQRDIAFVLASRAPLATLLEYRTRMGWDLPWVSSLRSDFNFDYGVSFTADQLQEAVVYNYASEDHPGEDREGLSVFAMDEAGTVFHTYSTYARGIDPLNAAYQLMDLTPKGRDEAGLSNPQAWVRRHDEYE
jgi:predicted dithiol-disulfide oxidoreductase (DUF899 family)